MAKEITRTGVIALFRPGAVAKAKAPDLMARARRIKALPLVELRTRHRCIHRPCRRGACEGKERGEAWRKRRRGVAARGAK